jgi:pyruvate kinase
MEAGVCVLRLNFSHGTLEEHGRRVEMIRRVAREARLHTAILGDLQGPKIRIGVVPEGVRVLLRTGQEVVLSASASEASLREEGGGVVAVLPVTEPGIVREVKAGHRVLINDGAVRLLAVEEDDGRGELRCLVRVGGVVTSGKGINVPDTRLSVSSLTARDERCVRFAAEHGLDFLALSFVRSAEDVASLRRSVREAGGEREIPIVAKIELPEAVRNIEGIVAGSDAVMVARGDMGVEMDISRVPVEQKRVIEVCQRHGKPCVVATQMLETMIENPSPTRAEASDVANAVFDGADGVMLSGETAVGKHPVLVVETMARIIGAAEERLRELPGTFQPPTVYPEDMRPTAALAQAAWMVAKNMNAKAVACWSQHGNTARFLSQTEFRVPIIAYTSDPQAARRMSLLRGVLPECTVPPGRGTLSEWNAAVDAYILARGVAKVGDTIVLIAGRPLGKVHATNTLAIAKVGEPTSGYAAST